MYVWSFTLEVLGCFVVNDGQARRPRGENALAAAATATAYYLGTHTSIYGHTGSDFFFFVRALRVCGINSYGCGVCCVTGLTFVRGLPSSLIFIQDVGRQRQAATTGDRRYVGSHVVRPPTGLNYLTTAVNNNNNNRQQIPSYQHFRHPARSPNQHKRMVPQRRLPVNANQLSVLHEIKPWLYYNTHTHTTISFRYPLVTVGNLRGAHIISPFSLFILYFFFTFFFLRTSSRFSRAQSSPL